MTTVKFSTMQDRKPIKVNVDGEDICLTRVGDEV
ncbi:MAG: Rieske (2Fe-2S) protein, partial [Actinobacteria bacterium]|nr:Rieske (2Fe-2S) protein [Actinomycetota bacterium]